MARKIGPEDIITINEAYLACGTYSGAAKATGFAPSTCKKYIDPNYVPKSQPIIEEPIELPLIDELKDELPPWYDLTCLTPEEEKEIAELWKELSI